MVNGGGEERTIAREGKIPEGIRSEEKKKEGEGQQITVPQSLNRKPAKRRALCHRTGKDEASGVKQEVGPCQEQSKGNPEMRRRATTKKSRENVALSV